MAIQMRRGDYTLYDATKLVPGEWAVILENDPNTIDGRSVYMCFEAGTAKRMATADEISAIAGLTGMTFKGTIGTGGTVTTLPSVYQNGWFYEVITTGTYAGKECVPGDMLIAITDRDGTTPAQDSDWVRGANILDALDIDIDDSISLLSENPVQNKVIAQALYDQKIWYAKCSTGTTTSAKVATLTGSSDGFALVAGTVVAVKFVYSNTYNGQITLNVNSTGAYSVSDYGQFYDGGSRIGWDYGQIISFSFTGSSWEAIDAPIITDSDLDALEVALGIS